MIAFAGNSVLCRLAFQRTGIDAASFTSIRLVSGALVLWLLVRARYRQPVVAGNWLSALALFVYAAGFSLAYLTLSTASGALLLFGAVQATMIGYGIRAGERLRGWQLFGLIFALGGLVGLLLPGLSAPPLGSALLMLVAGVGWGIYSLRGKAAGDPLAATAQNFARAVPFAVVLSLVMLNTSSLDWAGSGYALASGALASGIGYALWYAVLPELQATTAACVQLSVPPLAALGGTLFLGEVLTLRLVMASVAILGGIALVFVGRRRIRP